jgi:hypothetical protein
MSQHIIVVDIGDFAGDGHGRASSYYLYSNKSRDDVRDAYFLAKVKHPNLCPANYCFEYGDNCLPEYAVEDLIEHGGPLPEDPSSVTEEDMLKWLLWFIGLGDPEIKFEPVEAKPLWFCGKDSNDRFSDIIGYGCFER